MKTTRQLYYFAIFFLLCIEMNAQDCIGIDGQLKWEAWQGLFDDEFSELSAHADYPTRPSVENNVFKIQTPVNYDNLFGSRIRGFLRVDSNTSATFNVTGNDKVRFYLSDSASPENKELIAYTDGATGSLEHDKYESQTSEVINLVTGVYYYFEMFHVEASSSDHATVFWKTDLVDTEEWNVISANYLTSYGCEQADCAEVGTPCDDGDASTTNDVEDGYCNCAGTPFTSNSCIGERSKITAYRYDSISGSGINELYDAPHFPTVPNTSEQLDFFGKGYQNQLQEFGTAVQAFLSVPVSGNYKFNITGDDNTVLFLSSDDTYENRQAHQALVSSWTNMTEHDKFIWQSTSNIYLEKGQYYYIEINHKEGGGGEHFSAFWQTPWTEEGTWKRIPSIYFYDYTCELACISEGVPCDDGNIFTNNDMYNDACECVGTPCSGPDCDDPLANYTPIDKCNKTDMLDNRPDNNWLSCEVTPNPNTSREDGHWIMYDLGERYELHSSHIWNYNVFNETDQGFQSVAVDYSIDGVTWVEYGQYFWDQATGDSGYSGFEGPNFMGTYGQYILITSLDDPSECRGLGKVTFDAVLCPVEGTVCDDNDPNTVNDKFNNNCECIGQDLLENECDVDILSLGDSTIYTDVYSAETFVNSISKVADNNTISFIGGSSVVLDVGFETGENTLFVATIDPCETNGQRNALMAMSREELIEELRNEVKEMKKALLTVKEVENADEQRIRFYVETPGQVTISLNDQMGNSIYTIVDHEYRNAGLYTKRLATKKLQDGVYSIEYINKNVAETRTFTVEKQ